MDKRYQKLAKGIIKWHQSNPREMPWSGIKNPYKIWISEIILQQTRVNQGWEYYLRFTTRFPDVHILASAKEDDVLKMWEGLGYYSRARNILKAAKLIVSEYDGHLPDSYEEIIKLPGIGPYTASAILSFAFEKEFAVVDGNVIRVVARLFGIQEDTNSQKTIQTIKEHSNQLIHNQLPSLYNQSVMNFGALVCTPASPSCDHCPLNKECIAAQKNLVTVIPNKKKKIKKKKRYFHYFEIIDEKGKKIIQRRSNGDIWAGLYEFPLIEKQKYKYLTDVELKSFINGALGIKNEYQLEQRKRSKSILSHQIIHLFLYKLKLRGNHLKYNALIVTNRVDEYAFPKLLDLYLQEE